VKYDPYPGVLRGAQGTLWSKAGNAADQAVLLAALLAEALVPTRFVIGSLDDAAVTQLGNSATLDAEGPQLELGGVGESGAAHDQTAGDRMAASAGGVVAFGDLGVAVAGVVDVDPGVIGDRAAHAGDDLVDEPAPSAHARARAWPMTASSWRT